MTTESILHESPLDARRFGVRAVRGSLSREEDLPRLALELESLAPDLAMVRCPVAPPSLAQGLERAGFELMDTLVYFAGPVPKPTACEALTSGRVRPLEPTDVAPLSEVARQAFTGFAGHYHADPRLDGAKATAGYVEWFTSQCSDPAVVVLTAVNAARPTGFLTLKLDEGPDGAEIVLNAVAPSEQGRGTYDALVKAALHVAAERGKSRLKVSTQLHNLAPQKVWARNGLEPSDAFYTFHWWAKRSTP